MIVIGIDPGTANTGYGVIESAGSRLRAIEDGVIETRAGTPLERRLADIHERVCELIDIHQARCDRDRGALLRRQCADRIRGRAGPGRGAAGRRPARCARHAPTRPNRSRGRSAATAGPVRTRSAAWSPGCSGSPPCRRPTTPPTRSPWRSATSTARRCARPARRGSAGVIALVSGRVAVRRDRPRRDRLRRRRLPAGRLDRDARARPGGRARGLLHAHLVVRDDALALYGFATEDERELFLMLLGRPVGRAEGGAGGALGRARRGSCWPRSPPATPRGCRPCPGSASEPPSGSSSSCARRSGRRLPSGDLDHPRRRSALAGPRGADRPRLQPAEADELLDGADGDRPEELIAHALRTARR